jgi:hypothetical protein
MNLIFEKSEKAIDFLDVCASLMEFRITSTEHARQVSIACLILDLRNGGDIVLVDDEIFDSQEDAIIRLRPDELLIAEARENLIPSDREIRNEFYESCTLANEIAPTYQAFSLLWKNKLHRPGLSALTSDMGGDGVINKLAWSISLYNKGIERMFEELSVFANGDIPELYAQPIRLKRRKSCSVDNSLNSPQLNVIGENPQPNTKKEDTVKPQRTINVEELKGYFKSTFKGIGNGNIDYFSWLIGHLKIDRNGKEFAQIALMIYDSGKMNNTKPSTFKEWYRIFCDCVGCEYKSYDKNKLRNPREDIKNLFNYLQTGQSAHCPVLLSGQFSTSR